MASRTRKIASEIQTRRRFFPVGSERSSWSFCTSISPYGQVGKEQGGGVHKERLFLTTDLNKRPRRPPFIVEDARKRVPPVACRVSTGASAGLSYAIFMNHKSNLVSVIGALAFFRQVTNAHRTPTRVPLPRKCAPLSCRMGTRKSRRDFA